MIFRRLAAITYVMLMIVVEHHSTWGSGFSCDFGTLNPITGRGLHDCDVTQDYNRGWRVISGNDYPSKYWQDTTGEGNGGFFISWTRDQNGRSIFRLPHFQMSTPFTRLSFYYKIFGKGRNRLRVTLCDDVIFDVTDKKGLWIKSPDLSICCYEGGWNWPEISFEVTWTAQTGRIAVDEISVASDASVQRGYRNDGGSCTVLTKHPQSSKGEALKTTSSSLSSSTSLHSQANYSSPLPHVTITHTGGTASTFDLVKTFPTNVAFLVPTCTLVIVVVLIAVYLTRKYCCSCRRGSKPCEQHVSLATLAKQKEGAEESTYQSLNEPSELFLQKSKSQDTPGLSSGDDCHVYSDCLDVRPIPISLRLSAENSHDRCERSPSLSFSKGSEQRESGKDKNGLRRNDLGCIHEYFDMSENSKEGQVDTEILPKMTSAAVVRSDMASLDGDGVYGNIVRTNAEMTANTTEEPHIYNNTNEYEEYGTYVEFQEYENVCG